MSSEHVDGLTRPVDAELAEALIEHCDLSPEDVRRITETMHERNQDFCETALQLNLATRENVDDVMYRMRRSRGRESSVIDAAIRIAKGDSTALTVRQGVARLSSALTQARDADSARSEKIRALRTDLMLLNDSAQRGNVFALVSPGRGEGRSQLCAELAIAFAELGRRTLLVDADMRHPRQHMLFSAENQLGLAQSLSHGEAPYLHGVQGLPDLVLLTAGTVPTNPLELVSGRNFERLITGLRRQHDFIVIDTPAVSQYADALQVATIAQRVLVVSRSEATSLQSLKEMLRRLTVTESRVLGAVINKF
jgi:protein-tyrosine kinase